MRKLGSGFFRVVDMEWESWDYEGILNLDCNRIYIYLEILKSFRILIWLITTTTPEVLKSEHGC